MALLLLCGLPASGKTTFAKRITCILSERYRVSHNEFDSFSSIEADKPKKWQNDQVVFKEHLRKVVSTLKAKKEVSIVDDILQYRSMRRYYIKLAEEFSTGLVIFYFKTTLRSCLERNSSRKRQLPEATIYKLANEFEIPLTSEFGLNKGNANIIEICLSNANGFLLNGDNIESICSIVDSSVIKMMQPIHKDQKVLSAFDRKRTMSNQRHIDDQLLRKMVSVAFTALKKKHNLDKESFQYISRGISNKRKVAIKELRTCNTLQAKSILIRKFEQDLKCLIDS